MVEPAVANASPIIFLARGGYLDLLQLTGARVVVPTSVALEIRRRGAEDVTARALDGALWLEIVDPPSVPPVIHAWDLGPGESAVLAWAHAHPGCEAIIDDLAARRCAATLGVPVRGTLGIVLLAKKDHSSGSRSSKSPCKPRRSSGIEPATRSKKPCGQPFSST